MAEISRKQQIMETYLELGSEMGFQSVSLSDIASELGMKKASLFSHFDSYDDLRQSSWNLCRTHLSSASFNVNFKASDARQLLHELFQNFIDVFMDRPVIWWCSLLTQLETTDEQVASWSAEMDRMICARITVALDFCNQRSWTNIQDTDFLATVMTGTLRREITKAIHDQADFEALFSGLTGMVCTPQ